MMYLFFTILTLWISQTYYIYSSSQKLSNLGELVEGRGERLTCDKKDGCKESIFTCVLGQDCKVECTEKSSCEQLIIDGNGATSLEVECTGAGGSCKELNMDGSSVVGDVRVVCSGKDACGGADTILKYGLGEGLLECIEAKEACKGITVYESKDFKCTTIENCAEIYERIPFTAAEQAVGLSDNDNVAKSQLVIQFGQTTMTNIWVLFIFILVNCVFVNWCCLRGGKKATKVTFDHENGISKV